MDWSYFVLAELLFFVLFLLFLLWQYLSLKKDKAKLAAQRRLEQASREQTKPALSSEA